MVLGTGGKRKKNPEKLNRRAKNPFIPPGSTGSGEPVDGRGMEK
jgi:hypothetical protein